MAAPVILQFSGLDALSRGAAAMFMDICERTLLERGVFTVALSGGTTPAGLYKLLAAEHAGDADWGMVMFFWGDERCVPPEDEQSNYRLAYDSFLRHIRVPGGNIHRIRGELGPEKAAEDYDLRLREALGPRPPFAVDLMLLGMGADGHTASLFPGSPALCETERLAVPVLDKAPARVSLTFPLINASRHVMFLVSGKDKARALRDVFAKGGRPPLPAAMVKPERSVWLIDEEAGSMLPPGLFG